MEEPDPLGAFERSVSPVFEPEERSQQPNADVVVHDPIMASVLDVQPTYATSVAEVKTEKEEIPVPVGADGHDGLRKRKSTAFLDSVVLFTNSYSN
jgi:hypothetical protein